MIGSAWQKAEKGGNGSWGSNSKCVCCCRHMTELLGLIACGRAL